MPEELVAVFLCAGRGRSSKKPMGGGFGVGRQQWQLTVRNGQEYNGQAESGRDVVREFPPAAA